MLSDPVAREQARPMAISSRPRPQVIDQAWLGGLGVVLDELAGELHRELQREPDTGDLLLVLASTPDTLAGRALRELGANLDQLPAIVDRIRTQALVEDELAQQIQKLTEAKQQAIENVARLRAQERELREQADARTIVKPETLHKIRRQLGIPAPIDPPSQPPGAG